MTQSFINKCIVWANKQLKLTLNSSPQLDFWYPDATHVAVNMRVDFRVSEKESQSIQFVLDQNKMHYE